MSEKGYITPVSVMLSLIIIAICLNQVRLVQNERHFLADTKKYYQVHAVLQMGLHDMVHLFKENQKIPQRGSFSYEKGTVTYTIIDQQEPILVVKLVAKSLEDSKSTGYLHYDSDRQMIVKWVEG